MRATFIITEDIAKKLAEANKKTDVPKSKIVVRALERYLGAQRK